MKKTLLCCLILSAISTNSLAEPKKGGKTGESGATRQAKSAKAGKPIDYQPFMLESLGAARIDPRYQGISARRAFVAVEELTQLTKGEFESTADFEERKKAALNAKFLGNLTLTDLIPFVMKVEKKSYGQPVTYEYDADKAEVTLSALGNSESFNGIGAKAGHSGFSMRNFENFRVESVFEPTENYTGTNAYGASVAVEKIRGSHYGFASDTVSGRTSEKSPERSVTIQMDAARASRELPFLKAILVMRPRAPYVLYHLVSRSPTRGDPVDLHNYTKFLFGDVVAVIFYSSKTGEVLGRFPEQATTVASTGEVL